MIDDNVEKSIEDNTQRAIDSLTQRHTHKAHYEDGILTRACDLCGKDIADGIHFRVNEHLTNPKLDL